MQFNLFLYCNEQYEVSWFLSARKQAMMMVDGKLGKNSG